MDLFKETAHDSTQQSNIRAGLWTLSWTDLTRHWLYRTPYQRTYSSECERYKHQSKSKEHSIGTSSLS